MRKLALITLTATVVVAGAVWAKAPCQSQAAVAARLQNYGRCAGQTCLRPIPGGCFNPLAMRNYLCAVGQTQLAPVSCWFYPTYCISRVENPANYNTGNQTPCP